MADLTDELAGLNENARLLLEKYDGVFAQLDEQSKQALIDIANKSDEGLQAIQTLLDNGSVAEAENALKLGGKSLDEVFALSLPRVMTAKQIDEIVITADDWVYIPDAEIVFPNTIIGSKLIITASYTLYHASDTNMHVPIDFEINGNRVGHDTWGLTITQADTNEWWTTVSVSYVYDVTETEIIIKPMFRSYKGIEVSVAGDNLDYSAFRLIVMEGANVE